MNIPVLNVWDESQKKYVGIPAISGGGGGKITQEQLPAGYPWDGRTVIEWDGNAEGREVLEIPQTNPLYRVSDVVLTATDLNADGSILAFSSGDTADLVPFTVVEEMGVTLVLVSTMYVVASGTADAFAAVGMDLPSGTYFGKEIGLYGYLASLTYGTATPISETLLPESVKRVVVNVTMDMEGVHADKTLAEISALIDAGCNVVAAFSPPEVDATMFFYPSIITAEMAIFSFAALEVTTLTLQTIMFTADNGVTMGGATVEATAV